MNNLTSKKELCPICGNGFDSTRKLIQHSFDKHRSNYHEYCVQLRNDVAELVCFNRNFNNRISYWYAMHNYALV